MKHILFAFLLFPLLLEAQTQNLQIVKTYWDPWTKTKLKEVYNLIPRTQNKQGLYRGYDSNGILMTESNFLNGKLNGVVKHYYTADVRAQEHGKLGSIETYKNDVLDGLSEEYQYPKNIRVTVKSQTYQNGNLIKQTTYFDNGKIKGQMVQNGLTYSMYENGQKEFECNTVNGKGNGVFTSWYENGKIKEKGRYESDKKKDQWVTFYDTGDTMAIITYDDNNRVLQQQGYLNDGKKTSLVRNPDGKFIETQYYPSGHKFSETEKVYTNVTNPSWGKTGMQFINNGDYTEYFESGKVKVKGSYYGEKKTFRWTTYDEDGKVVHEEQLGGP